MKVRKKTGSNRLEAPFELGKEVRTNAADRVVTFNLDELGLEEEGLDTEEVFYDLLEEETLKEVAEQTTYGTVFLNDLVKRQRALSISVAIVFLVIVFSLPLLNFFVRSLVSFEIFGFDISWLVLGILIYPLIWWLAFYFVSTADKYEEDFTKLVK
ncbi:MAG TPA: DUF485 domain-containing protein [Chloroflexia bacterium]|nr:DUF485 domain-containing protein [Chloroflexia bacterium]